MVRKEKSRKREGRVNVTEICRRSQNNSAIAGKKEDFDLEAQISSPERISSLCLRKLTGLMIRFWKIIQSKKMETRRRDEESGGAIEEEEEKREILLRENEKKKKKKKRGNRKKTKRMRKRK